MGQNGKANLKCVVRSPVKRPPPPKMVLACASIRQTDRGGYKRGKLNQAANGGKQLCVFSKGGQVTTNRLEGEFTSRGKFR